MTTSPPSTETRQPVLYLSHGAPPLADDPPWTGELAAWSADLPRPQGSSWSPRTGRRRRSPSRPRRRCPLTLRLLGLPAALLPGDLRRPRRARARRRVAKLLRRRRPARSTRTSRGARPRRLRAAGGDVPGRRRPGAADVDADARPARLFEIGRKLAPLRDAGHADRRLRLHHPQPALVQPGAPARTRRRPARRPSSTHWAQRGDAGRSDVDALLDFLTRPRPPARPTRAPSTSRRSSSRWAPPTSPAARQRERHRRLLVRPVQAVLAVRLTAVRLSQLG